MIIDLGNSNYSIYVLTSEGQIRLEGVDRWIRSLKYLGRKQCRNSTIRSYVNKLEKFFYWSLANPVSIEEDLFDYLIRFKNDVIMGFIIKSPIIIDDVVHYDTNFKVGPMSQRSFVSFEAAIYSYFGVNNKQNMKSLYTDRDNLMFNKYRESYGKLSSLNIKISKDDTPKQKKNTGPLQKQIRNFKDFPMELFDELLELASTRMKLIYLLCGATSARIGQVLNLTINDINFTSLQVRLISPHSDEVDDYGHSRKIWLFNKYNIDMDSNNEHNQPDLQFKYRIPAHHTYLYWLDENKYKNLFFETLEIYLKKNYIDINDRTQKHPFFFTTKSSKRYRGNYAYNTFKRHCEVLAQKHEGYKLQLENLKGTHSLRHMFGRVLAEYAIKTNNQNILMLVAEAMGHENIFSTLEYFKPGDNAIKEAFRKVLEPFDSTQPINDNDIKMCLTAALKLKNTHRSSTV